MLQSVDISALTTRPPFSTLFRIDADVLAGITASMSSQGFDEAFPIISWDNVVVCGHTRLRAAAAVGLDRVLCVEREFASEDDAVLFALREQAGRRNLTAAGVLDAMAAEDRIKARGGDHKSEKSKASRDAFEANGKSAAETGSLLGISQATVERARVVNADPVARAAVVEDGASINAAYKQVQERKKHEREAAPPKPQPLLPDLPQSALRGVYTVAEWNALSERDRRFLVTEYPDQVDVGYNRTNENVEWALWTWNPVTGCLHDCTYCYARDIAARFYPQGFVPAFVPGRLHAPRKKKIPTAAIDNLGERNVFTCSMADLFGKWVPQAWIDAVFSQTLHAPEWNFLYLTKFPQRLATLEWPKNAWCGTTVDRQNRVANAEKSFLGVTAGIKWLSCEPMLERLTFRSLEMFDWVVIGGASESSQTPAFQPPWEWVEHLIRQARDAGCRVYVKPNLLSRPREYPGWNPEEMLAPPPFYPHREP